MTEYGTFSPKRKALSFLCLLGFGCLGLVPWQPVPNTAMAAKPPVASQSSPVQAQSLFDRKNEKAPVTIMFFHDFQCSYCVRGYGVLQEVARRFPKDVRFVLKHFPLSFHKDAHLAAQASLAAQAQGKFSPYFKLLMKQPQDLRRTALEAYAQQVGLEQKSFQHALDQSQYRAQIDADIQLGKMLGVKGVPSFFLNGEKVVGVRSAEKLSEIIRKELKSIKEHRRTRMLRKKTAKSPQTSNFVSIQMRLSFGAQQKQVEAQLTVPFGEKAMMRHQVQQDQWTITFTPHRVKQKTVTQTPGKVMLKFSIQRQDKGQNHVTSPTILTYSGKAAQLHVGETSRPESHLRLWVLPTIRTPR